MTVLSSQALRATSGPRPFPVDPWLTGAWIGLLGLGLVMVYSATVAAAGHSLSAHFGHLVNHVLHISAGVALAVLISVMPLYWWERAGKAALVAGLVLLGLVLVPGVGVEVNGSTRWLPLGPTRIQPSELMKICMVIYAAGYLTRKRDELRDFTQGVVMIGLVLGLVALLLLLEPDFGSFVVIALTVVGMLFLAGIRLWHFLLCLLLGGTAMVLLTVISPYRMARVMSFLHPWSDPYDSGFQLVQALIAFGRGEWHGVGLGASIQKLYYLPHANNDFLLAVIAEELGVVGVLLVVALFGIVLWRAFAIARRADLLGAAFAGRLAQGLGLLLVIQAMINLGVNMGVLPTKGLTLPFMSYGGSSMLSACIAMGLLLAVDRATQRKRRPRR